MYHLITTLFALMWVIFRSPGIILSFLKLHKFQQEYQHYCNFTTPLSPLQHLYRIIPLSLVALNSLSSAITQMEPDVHTPLVRKCIRKGSERARDSGWAFNAQRNQGVSRLNKIRKKQDSSNCVILLMKIMKKMRQM